VGSAPAGTVSDVLLKLFPPRRERGVALRRLTVPVVLAFAACRFAVRHGGQVSGVCVVRNRRDVKHI